MVGLRALLSALALGAIAIAQSMAPAVVSAAPIQAPSTAVSVGGLHVCALPGDGTVLCWNYLDVNQNEFGERGGGFVIDPDQPAGDVWVQQIVVADQASAQGGDCVDATDDGFIVRCHGSASLSGVTALAAGYSHTCALLVDTTVKCWGANEAHKWSGDPIDPVPSYSGGAVGDGTTTIRPAPVTVIAGPGETRALAGVRSISAAAYYSCAVLVDNTAKCWGNSPQEPSLAPITVTADGTLPLTGIASIAAGDDMACAGLLDGSVVCWGKGLLGDQLSDGRASSTTPVRVSAGGAANTALGGIAQVAVANGVGFVRPNGFGMGHACALATLGGVSCWGLDDVSQVGAGIPPGGAFDYAVSVAAAPDSTDVLSGAQSIAAGGYFTCALIDDGSVKCWGLGLGREFEGAGGPIPLDVGGKAIAIAAAGGHLCATLDDGSLWCSEADDYSGSVVAGVVIAAPAATPSPPSATASPTPVATTAPSTSAATPTAPATTASAGAVRVTGLTENCLLFSAGTVACSLDTKHPPIPVSGITDATAISGRGGTTCAVREGGGIVCWGLNSVGQLGNGTLVDSHVPVPVSGITDAIAVSVGDLHACAIRTGGVVLCWGHNFSGELGNGGSEDSSIPVPAAGVSKATVIAAGGDHTCAIVEGGGVECWGSANELGTGAGPELPTPTTAQPVAGISDATALAAGRYYTCVVRSSGTVLCWGLQDPAQVVATGTVDPVLLPLQVPGIADATALAAGLDHTCAVRTGGGVVCWGTNESGQLGDGSTDDSATAVDVSGVEGATAITAGIGNGCALDANGRVVCWGLDFDSLVPVPIVLAAPAASPAPTPTPTPPATMSADIDGLAGPWNVGPTPVSISFDGGQYSVRTTGPMHIIGMGCDLPNDTLLATFTGSGGVYSGQSAIWNTRTCEFLDWMPTTLKLQGNQLVAALPNGGQQVFTRGQAAVPFRASVPTISQVSTVPIIVLQSVVLAVGFVLLIPFPGALFDNTFEANYAEVVGWGTTVRRRLIGPFGRRRPSNEPRDMAEAPATEGWRSLPRLAFALLLGVLLGCLLDPTFGLNVTSLATFVGVLGGVLITMLVFAIPLRMAYRSQEKQAAEEDRVGWDPYLRALPAALIVAVGCVLISRLTNFQPGYLYGLLIGVTAAHSLSDRQSARTAAIAVVVMLLIAAAAWLGYSLVVGLAPASTTNLVVVLLQTVLVTIMVAGVQGAFFSLLPLRFFAGAKMIKWNRWIWGALLAITGLVFWHVLVNPTSGYLANSSRTPLVTIYGLLLFFGLGSVLFWAYFRFRKPRVNANPTGGLTEPS